MSDLFSNLPPKPQTYTAKDIEVLEGLEPVRKRPGMYIGGTDEKAMHHLVAEVLDNAMDEAVAGHASFIDVDLAADGTVTIRDNGRGIPVDAHPKYADRSALEVIFTTLHSGGKFGGDAYKVSGGLHGVGSSVVNALSEHMVVEVARERQLWRQVYERGCPRTPLELVGAVSNRRGTTIRFRPDPDIFGTRARFRPVALYHMARSKAYLFRGVKIRWSCDPALLDGSDSLPPSEELHFPNGLQDFLNTSLEGRTIVSAPYAGSSPLADDMGSVEWALCWPEDQDGFFSSYVNTVPTPEGGTHETGLRNAITKGLRGYAELVSNRKGSALTAEDTLGGACVVLSVFIRDPQFQGQTKEKLASVGATRLVEQAIRDHFDHWLAGSPSTAHLLLEQTLQRQEDRLRRKQSRELTRKTATKKLRLPGKLADCSRSVADGTELFIVEGDSAGGSAKQARNREIQAILPLRGKILNVASASAEKLSGNKELHDLVEALGCGTRTHYDPGKVRYEKIIIMTDADVDGAHIASLLMTFFYREFPGLIQDGRLFLAMPPLYRLTQGGKSFYARDDAHKEKLMKRHFKGKGKVDVSRFKGLGEMPPAQLRETTMNPSTRTLLKITLPDVNAADGHNAARATECLVEQLMGRKPEARFNFIQTHARFAEALDI